MNFTYNPFTKTANVKLSRSNLKALLHLLEVDPTNPSLIRITEDDWILYVTAESDEDHYGSRERGLMNKETEEAINGN